MSKILMRVPTFIMANDKQSLTQLMMKNNLKHDTEFQYFDIQKEGSAWVAWFYLDFSKNDLQKPIGDEIEKRTTKRSK